MITVTVIPLLSMPASSPIIVGNLVVLAAIEAAVRAAPTVICLVVVMAATVMAMAAAAAASPGVRPKSSVLTIFQNPLLFQV